MRRHEISSAGADESGRPRSADDDDASVPHAPGHAVKFDGISSAMADDKLNRAADTGASHIVACDMSCLMHLDGRARRREMPLKCVHLAQVLAGKL